MPMDNTNVDITIVAQFLSDYYLGTTGAAFEAAIRALKELENMPDSQKLALKASFQYCLTQALPINTVKNLVIKHARPADNDAEAREFLKQVYDDCALEFVYAPDELLD